MRNNEPRQRALREGRVSISNWNYFITKSASVRIPKDIDPKIACKEGLLLQPGVPEIIVSNIRWLTNNEIIDILAYVIMPDHLHLLFKLGFKYKLEEVMAKFCSYTAKQVRDIKTVEQGLWQKGFHDHVVRDKKDFGRINLYIQQNPLKRGLIEDTEEWPYYWAQL